MNKWLKLLSVMMFLVNITKLQGMNFFARSIGRVTSFTCSAITQRQQSFLKSINPVYVKRTALLVGASAAGIGIGIIAVKNSY